MDELLENLRLSKDMYYEIFVAIIDILDKKQDKPAEEKQEAK